MLQKLRDRTQSLGFKIIVAALVFALAFFGFGAFNVFAPGDPEIASVNGDGITRGMLEVETERQRRRIMLQLGDEVGPDAIDPLALQQAALEQLIVRSLLEQATDDLGLRASQAQVDETVASDPNFQVDGRFNESLYRRGISALGYSAPEYLQEMAALLRVNQLHQAVVETAVLPLWETRLLTGLMNQRRDIAYLPFTVEHFSAGVAIEPDEVRTYYDEHTAEFMTGEAVDVEYLELSWQALLDDPAIEVDEESVRSEYEVDKANAGGEELRSSSHILLQVTDERDDGRAMAQLREIRGRIESGESFADLAREYSEDPGSSAAGGELGSVGEGMFDPEFERVLWGLEEDGQISEPVKTQFGYHLIRLDGIEIQTFPAFEELRADIEERLTEAAARELFKDRVRELDNLAFEMNDSLDAIAETLDLEKHRAEGVTRESGAGIFVNAELREALFEADVLIDGNNSAALEYVEGRAVVSRCAGAPSTGDQAVCGGRTGNRRVAHRKGGARSAARRQERCPATYPRRRQRYRGGRCPWSRLGDVRTRGPDRHSPARRSAVGRFRAAEAGRRRQKRGRGEPRRGRGGAGNGDAHRRRRPCRGIRRRAGNPALLLCLPGRHPGLRGPAGRAGCRGGCRASLTAPLKPPGPTAASGSGYSTGRSPCWPISCGGFTATP